MVRTVRTTVRAWTERRVILWMELALAHRVGRDLIVLLGLVLMDCLGQNACQYVSATLITQTCESCHVIFVLYGKLSAHSLYYIPYILFNLYISLTLHLGIILVDNQLDPLFSMYLFISLLYMFRATLCSWSGESNCINTSSGISLCVGDWQVCWSGSSWLAYQAVTYTEWYIPDDVLTHSLPAI